MFVGTKDD